MAKIQYGTRTKPSIPQNIFRVKDNVILNDCENVRILDIVVGIIPDFAVNHRVHRESTC